MSQPPPPTTIPRQRRRSAMALAALVPDAVAPALRERGFASAAILTEWREIVGPHLARWTSPIEIRWPRRPVEPAAAPARGARKLDARATLAVLKIACPGAFALEVQMAGPAIIAAVNRRLGFGCIGAIEIHQAPRREIKVQAPRIAPDDAAIGRIDASLTAIEAPDLRRALAVLGAEIAARSTR